MKGVLTCLDRFSNSMPVSVFIFRRAHGKGSAHRERHGDGLAGGLEASGGLGLGLPFTWAMSVQWDVADPASQVSCTVGDAPARGGRGCMCAHGLCAGCEARACAV